jgi:RNA polymerase sigma factor (sigma-70 family)
MGERSTTTEQIQNWLDRLRAGDDQARKALMQHAYGRLESLASSELRKFPALRSIEETGSILHETLLRLDKALEEVQPGTARQFFKLAAQRIRWLLLDLKKRARHQVLLRQGDNGSGPPELAADATGAVTLAERAELHEIVDALPDEQREVVDLLQYQGLSCDESAAILGISERTVKRRWREARLAIAEALGGNDD